MNPRLVRVARVGGPWRTATSCSSASVVATTPFSGRSNIEQPSQSQVVHHQQHPQHHQQGFSSPLLLLFSHHNLTNDNNSNNNRTTTQRLFSTVTKKLPCPFKTLGVSKSAKYKKVKTMFLQIAMSHHPDTNKAETEEQEKKYREAFIKARQAFESLMESEDGGVMLKPLEEETSDQEFDNWFMKETGHSSPYSFLDPQTMKEVAEMEENIGHGLDRDGGMWTLAAMVSNAVKDGKDGASLLRLEAGEVKEVNGHIDGELRRTRRNRR
mmetsp:Transcript_24524/g.37792  ORF Transcript_24524/g.37792 Transcript_24524/m.37792 type:complete len:268 (-) Transcript_24524:201-1004(-)